MISVIIPTRNRAGLLKKTLESLQAQTVAADTFEVLVVDNGSTDATTLIAEEFRLRIPSLRLLSAPEPGLHVGRHCGLREARGDILVFADDDIVAKPGWLAAIAEIYSDPEVAMSGGNNLPLFALPPPDWLQQLWMESRLEGGRALPALSLLELPGDRRPIDPFLVWGCNFAIRRAVLESAGGFHPDAMPREMIRFRGDGESHVSRYVAERGLRCEFDPAASVWHTVSPERMTFAYFRKRGFDQGISDSYTALRRTGAAETRVKSALRLLRARLRSMLESGQAMREMTLGHAEGYVYHQRLFGRDPEIRRWVMKSSYR